MPFVKLDCGILNSTLWFEREAREVFITALLMAEPMELLEPTPQIAVHGFDLTGWTVPPGWYGFVAAAGVGILARASVSENVGLPALVALGSPDPMSRSPEYEGRRLVRVSGGFIVLNYMKYRDRDYTTADRSRRYRQRVASRRGVTASRRGVTASRRDITQAEAEAEAEVEVKKSGGRMAPPPTARSKRPIFVGQKLTVHEWMLDELDKLLAPHTNAFDLHEWFFALDTRCVQTGDIPPARDNCAWLKAETLKEAQRRGLPLRIAAGQDFDAELAVLARKGPPIRP